MSSESNSYYSDFGELDQCKVDDPIFRVVRINKNRVKVRVKEISWVKIHQFVNDKEYKDSDIAKKIEKEFMAIKQPKYSYADIKMYHCTDLTMFLHMLNFDAICIFIKMHNRCRTRLP